MRTALPKLVCCAVLCFVGVVFASHSFKEGDVVPLYANKLGPFSNPSETYEYYKLPFCSPKEEERKAEDLGEVLGGDRMVVTNYQIKFKAAVDNKPVCPPYKLTKDQVQAFQQAIEEDYYFEFFCDDLPLWGFIGEKEVKSVNGKNVTSYMMFTHYTFLLAYNEDKVIEVVWDHDPSKRLDITDASGLPELALTYSVEWRDTDVKFDDRMEKYQSFLPQQLEIHWFSIFNSFVTVLLLTGFLATILLRILKNDLSRYAQVDDDDEEEDETGWKLVHGDVFRFPTQKILFCSIVGNGLQLLVLCLGLLFLACVGVFYPYNRGSMYTASLVIFALTAGVAGYSSSSLYKKIGGEQWVWNIIFTFFLYIGPFFAMGTFLNFVAVSYNAAAALPFTTVIVIILILTLVGFPLTVVGGIAGRNVASPFEAPCRTTKLPREIPPLPWYREGACQVLIAGFLPFSAIYTELFYIFASVWGHKMYTIYGILLLVFLILVLVTSFITIALTYFQLAVEDHRWWWRSIFSGGSTGLFVAAYCVFYYVYRSDMTGFMQTSFFFGYMLIICYGFFLMLGTIGFYSALAFVRYIYKAVKCD